MKGKIAHKN